MSIDSDRAAAEKAVADKRIADEADASAAATADWPTGGYNTFTPLLFTFMCAVLVVCIDVSTIFLVRAYIIKIQYVISTAYVMFMIYYWIKLIQQLLNFSTAAAITAAGTKSPASLTTQTMTQARTP